MSGLLNLGKYVLVSFLVDWVGLKDFALLDSALCNQYARKALLSLIAEFHEQFQKSLFKTIYCRFSEDCFRWNKQRGLHLTYLHLNKLGVDELNNPIRSGQLSEVAYVDNFAAVDCDSKAVSDVIAAIGDSLREVYCFNLENTGLVTETVAKYCSNVTKISIGSEANFSLANLEQLCRQYSSSLTWLGDVLSSNEHVWPVLVHCYNLQTLEVTRRRPNYYSNQPLEAFLLHSSNSRLCEVLCCDWSVKALRLYLYKVNIRITELKLDDAERVDDSLLGEIASLCPCLRSLSFPPRCDLVSDSGVLLLASGLTQLQCLLLENVVSVSDSSLLALTSQCRSITHFSLKANSKVTDKGLASLSIYGSRLRSLSLKSMNLNGELLLLLLTQCCRLEELALSDNSLLCDADMVSAAPLMRCMDRLHLLNLPNLGDETLSAVALHCCDLTSLHIGHIRCGVTDSGLREVLTKCSKIRSLSLNSCYLLTSQSLVNILQYSPQICLLFMRVSGPVELTLLKRIATDLGRLVLLSLSESEHSQELERFIAETRPQLAYYPF